MKERTERHLQDFFSRKPELTYLEKNLRDSIALIVASVAQGHKILVCGNGGSASDCEHISGELLKSFMLRRDVSMEFREKLMAKYGAEEGAFLADNIQQGVPCIPLVSFSSLTTAFLNDCDGVMIFAQQVNALGTEGDVLLVISTSGNSRNVIYAAEIAGAKKMPVIAMTGRTGGKLKTFADILLNAPEDAVHLIQEYHEPLYHILCLCIESEMFDR